MNRRGAAAGLAATHRGAARPAATPSCATPPITTTAGATRRVAVLAAALLGAGMSATPPAVAQVLDAHVAVASDYVLHGVSRSQGDATLQADVGVRFARWSIGASAATMNLNPGPGPVRELGLYAGRALLTTQDWSLNGSLAAWRYGGRIPGLDYDYDEARLQLAWRARLRLDLAWSPNYSIGTRLGVAREADSYETALTLVQPVSRSLALSAGIGRFAIGGALDRGFWYWSAGATLTGERLSAALAWTGSEAVTRDMFSSRSADDRLVATVSLRLH